MHIGINGRGEHPCPTRLLTHVLNNEQSICEHQYRDHKPHATTRTNQKQCSKQPKANKQTSTNNAIAKKAATQHENQSHNIPKLIIQANQGAKPQKSPHWGLNPGPSVYRTDALPLSYKGHASNMEHMAQDTTQFHVLGNQIIETSFYRNLRKPMLRMQCA